MKREDLLRKELTNYLNLIDNFVKDNSETLPKIYTCSEKDLASIENNFLMLLYKINKCTFKMEYLHIDQQEKIEKSYSNLIELSNNIFKDLESKFNYEIMDICKKYMSVCYDFCSEHSNLYNTEDFLKTDLKELFETKSQEFFTKVLPERYLSLAKNFFTLKVSIISILNKFKEFILKDIKDGKDMTYIYNVFIYCLKISLINYYEETFDITL